MLMLPLLTDVGGHAFPLPHLIMLFLLNRAGRQGMLRKSLIVTGVLQLSSRFSIV